MEHKSICLQIMFESVLVALRHDSCLYVNFTVKVSDDRRLNLRSSLTLTLYTVLLVNTLASFATAFSGTNVTVLQNEDFSLLFQLLMTA